MLAERLLAKGDFDTDTEIRTLEHLKKRFGENNLHSCEASSVVYALHNGNCLGSVTASVDCMKTVLHKVPFPVRKARTDLARRQLNFKHG